VSSDVGHLHGVDPEVAQWTRKWKHWIAEPIAAGGRYGAGRQCRVCRIATDRASDGRRTGAHAGAHPSRTRSG